MIWQFLKFSFKFSIFLSEFLEEWQWYGDFGGFHCLFWGFSDKKFRYLRFKISFFIQFNSRLEKTVKKPKKINETKEFPRTHSLRTLSTYQKEWPEIYNFLSVSTFQFHENYSENWKLHELCQFSFQQGKVQDHLCLNYFHSHSS